VPGQVVQHQEKPQRRQFGEQRRLDRQAVLPTLPDTVGLA
jgi:hypothetical protein